METTPLSKYSVSFGLSLAFTSVANALLVVAKEESPALQATMKSMTGHHWITHVIAMVMLFMVLGFGLAKINNGQGVKSSSKKLLFIILSGIGLGAFLIEGFYMFCD